MFKFQNDAEILIFFWKFVASFNLKYGQIEIIHSNFTKKSLDMLYIVPTPVGNLEDMTLRGIRVLREVSLILAEDTRTSKKLLNHYEISTPMRSFHAHNEHAVVTKIADELSAGAEIALISDAGTPGISDPGFLLIRECAARQIPVTCLPGATAFVPAIVASGLPCDTFHFEGFLPHKKGRQTRLKILAELPHTFILYESPHRLLKCLEELAIFCEKERKAAVCREVSKRHEHINNKTLDELIIYYKNNPDEIRGEIVIIVEGKHKKSKSEI
jgi:16S rRNA (cytidine1402-2'-O)-methyltransferase